MHFYISHIFSCGKLIDRKEEHITAENVNLDFHKLMNESRAIDEAKKNYLRNKSF